MAKRKLTKWFSGEVKPDHVGMYQTSESLQFNDYYYNYWDGSRWHWGHIFIHRAHKNDPMPRSKVAKWRGLAEQPKEHPHVG